MEGDQAANRLADPPLVSVGATTILQQLVPERVGKAPLSAGVVEDKIAQNGSAAFQRYTVQSCSSSMMAEADVYAGLLRAGYTRMCKVGWLTIAAQCPPLE